MLKTVLSPIAKDLESVYGLLKEESLLVSSRTGGIDGLEYLSADTALRPSLVILSSRIYGGDSKKTTVLAVVMQLIYLAAKVHGDVSEDEMLSGGKGGGYRRQDRFSILLGDYFYSRASVIMLESEITGMLQVLAEIVSQIQEGRILKSKLSGFGPEAKMFYDIIRKETAELFAGCCLLGASLAGAGTEEQETMRSFGENFGMAFALAELGVAAEQIAFYVDRALKGLLSAPARPEKVVLEQLANMLSCGGANMQRMVG